MWSCIASTCSATAHTKIKVVEGRNQEFFDGRGKKNQHDHVADLSKVRFTLYLETWRMFEKYVFL